MLANLSTKTTASYIGNKGLGFRSILNWAQEVSILTNGHRVAFSPAIVKNIFESELGLSVEKQDALKKERNLGKQAIPFPILGIPQVSLSLKESEWATQIIIQYHKNYEGVIEEQLKAITPEILLFLQHIETITIEVEGKPNQTISSHQEKGKGFDLITIQNIQWKVFSEEGVLPAACQDATKGEQQLYNIKIAFRQDLAYTSGKLFTFFPTQVSISLPCLVHGTFELNSSRNYLNESPVNEYILGQLIGLLEKCALHLADLEVNWRPYQLLCPLQEGSDAKLIVDFYKQLKEQRDGMAIYPCVDQKYRSLGETYFYTDSFSHTFQHSFPDTLPELLQYGKPHAVHRFQTKYEDAELKQRIEALSNSAISIDLRAILIVALVDALEFRSIEMKDSIALLVNSDGYVIPSSTVAFTPIIKSDTTLRIPEQIELDFIHQWLYEILSALLEKHLKGGDSKHREMQRILKRVVNIQAYDSNNVIERIIGGNNKLLRDKQISREAKVQLSKEVVKALFANFQHIEAKQERLNIPAIYLINENYQVEKTDNLFLSESFFSHSEDSMSNEKIYGKKQLKGLLLPSIEFWEMDKEDPIGVQDFFLWLGVNRRVRFEPSTSEEGNAYVNFIFHETTRKPDEFDRGRMPHREVFSKLRDLDMIGLLDPNRIILLIAKEPQLKGRITQITEHIHWQYNRVRLTEPHKYTFIGYQFVRLELFTDYIIEENKSIKAYLNEGHNPINYKYLAKQGVEQWEVNEILLHLGAKGTFEELSSEQIYSIIEALPEVYPDGQKTMSIYKKCLEGLSKKEEAHQPNNLLFFARKKDQGKYLPPSKVYYGDNTSLPKAILDELYILNLQKRSGEQQVNRLFGVNTLSKFKLIVNRNSLRNNQYYKLLESYFEEIKPYLLAYRLHSSHLRKKVVSPEQQIAEASKLRDCQVRIVTHCKYDFGKKEGLQLNEGEFVNDGKAFYYLYSDAYTIGDLQSDSHFCDAFAEMMCIIFKVNELKTDFRQLFKNDVLDTNHVALQDLGDEKIREAFELLGISQPEITFWKKVFKSRDVEFPIFIKGKSKLTKYIKQHLGIELPPSYDHIDFDRFTNSMWELLQLLEKALGLKPNDLREGGIPAEWHIQKLENTIRDHKASFEKKLWAYYNNRPLEQAYFIARIQAYEKIAQEIITSKKMANSLNPNYQDILFQSIKEHFHINLSSSTHGEVVPKNLYTNLLNKYQVEDESLSSNLRSLLYFAGNEAQIQAYLAITHPIQNDETNPRTKPEESIKGELIDTTLSKLASPANPNGKPSDKSWIYSGKIGSDQRQQGKKAEEIAESTLVEKYGRANVRRRSGSSNDLNKNDNLHYDIEYKDETGEWRFLEVKSISGPQLIITASELQKAQECAERYDLALVDGTKVYIIRSPFLFEEGESLEKNSRFTLVPKDHILFFHLNPINHS